MTRQYMLTVLEKKSLTNTVFSMKLAADELVKDASPGQFIHIMCLDRSVLRRPISISEALNGILTIVVEARGEGTKWLAERRTGDKLDVIGPLGRGFDLNYKNIIVVGGGIGVPPMLFAARSAGAAAAVLGFRNKESVILAEDFRDVCENVYITSDDGSFGEHGTLALPLERLLGAGSFGAVLACGPRAMLKSVAALAAAYHVPCQVSMEERMGCGVGACLVCACRTQTGGKEKMSHVCKDGPVFRAEEVVW